MAFGRGNEKYGPERPYVALLQVEALYRLSFSVEYPWMTVCGYIPAAG